jgi:uroporphyrinogen decarboxylase
MNSRERIRTIISGEPADRCGLWLGNPHPDTWPIYLDAFNASDTESVRRLLQDDFRWTILGDREYRGADRETLFDFRRRGQELSAAGAFADCEDVQEVEDHDWPEPDDLDFTDALAKLRSSGAHYRASGFWAPFFHQAADFFGMENYFIKMYTHPEIVHAVTKHMVDFYLEANVRYFELAGREMDGYFFGNDFGTQLDTLISPKLFDEFVSPYFKQLTDLAHAYDYQVILHSCGSIHRVIPRLIEMGVEALHPLQALAINMDAETLARDFKGKLAFLGGVDTQDLLVNGTPDEVYADVLRVKALLGPNLIVSPSHEALLPNVSPENVRAMAEAAVEG